MQETGRYLGLVESFKRTTQKNWAKICQEKNNPGVVFFA